MVELMKKEVAGVREKTTFKQACGWPGFNSQFPPNFSANYVGADSVKPLGALPAKGVF